MKVIQYNMYFFCLAAVLSSCSRTDSAGNSIETENAVSIQVVFEDGRPAHSTLVRVRPIWFMADTINGNESPARFLSRDLLTDANGIILLDSLPSGTFLAEASNDSLAVAHEFMINEHTASGYFRQLTLTPSGSISGVFPLPEGAIFAWVYILGMEKVVRSDSTGRFLIEGIPEGALRIQGTVSGVESGIGEALVQVRSGRNTEIGTVSQLPNGSEDLELWQYNRNIVLDTLISDWMQPVTYPLVLTLRLDSSDFDFQQAMGAGEDIRITDMSGRALPSARAYWDRDRCVSTIRFRVDSSAPIRLWWGRASAAEVDDEIKLWEGIGDSLKNELAAILVDDFEDAENQSPMQPPIAPSNWYFMGLDSTVTLFPTMADGLLAGIEDAGHDRTGKAMHFQYSTPNAGIYVLFGISMGTGQPRDYSAMDSIVFWVKGTGNYLFAFDKLVGNAGKAAITDSLDTTWTKQVLRPSDFPPGDSIGGNIGWDMVRDSITNLTFMASGGTDFWIDDIRIYGLNRDDLK